MGRLAGRRESLGQPVDRQQRYGPAMAGADDVPGTQNGAGNAAGAEQGFAFGAHCQISVHQRGRLGDAEINEMLHRHVASRRDGGLQRGEVDLPEGSGLSRTGMGDADQMDQRIGIAQAVLETGGIECIAGQHAAAAGQEAFAPRTYQGGDPVAARQQRRHQATAEVAVGAGDEDAMAAHSPSTGFKIGSGASRSRRWLSVSTAPSDRRVVGLRRRNAGPSAAGRRSSRGRWGWARSRGRFRK
jgi:hypothetical protein